MFRRMANLTRKPLNFEFEGMEVEALEGDTVATALLAQGVANLRRAPVSSGERAPYCMMGMCFECLVEIDGVAHQQACLVPVKAGLRVARQKSQAEVGHDL